MSVTYSLMKGLRSQKYIILPKIKTLISSLMEKENENMHWYVMRTLGRFCEIGIKQKLADCGIRYYQAERTVVKTLNGKTFVSNEPVIPNLLFVYGSKEAIMPHTVVGNNFQFVYNRCSGKQADCLVVPTKAMEDFIRVAESEGNTQIFMSEEIQLAKGQRIRMIGGALDGVEGYFVRRKGCRRRTLVIVLDGLFGISAEVEPEMIEILN
jgi:hypothetical protein